MPKYWGKQIFAHGRFPEVGQKQKTEKTGGRDRTLAVKSRKTAEKPPFFLKKIKLFRTWEIPRSGSKAEDGEKRRKKGNNNGQATHGARKHAWRTQAAWAKRKNSW